MKLQVTLEESAELREYAMSTLKSQMKTLVRDELKAIAPALVKELAKTCSYDVKETVRKKLDSEINSYFTRKVMAEEIHDLINTKFNDEFSRIAKDLIINLFNVREPNDV